VSDEKLWDESPTSRHLQVLYHQTSFEEKSFKILGREIQQRHHNKYSARIEDHWWWNRRHIHHLQILGNLTTIFSSLPSLWAVPSFTAKANYGKQRIDMGAGLSLIFPFSLRYIRSKMRNPRFTCTVVFFHQLNSTLTAWTKAQWAQLVL